jgi:hypothetical protein
MKSNLWIAAAAVVFVLGAAGYTIAQSTGMGSQGMMGSGMGVMGQGGMMGSGMMSMMMGQPLSSEQVEQFAKQHGITTEQAKQMTDTCTQIMARTGTPQAQ